MTGLGALLRLALVPRRGTLEQSLETVDGTVRLSYRIKLCLVSGICG